MKPASTKTNEHDTRESWLRAATDELRTYFATCGVSVPNNIRFAIAFPSTGRRGARIGECWHSSTSADGNYEIIIRADIADPIEVLGVLTHELVHAALPPEVGHGKPYREAALKLGMEGKMRHAMPGHLLRERLAKLAESIGPLPHARLDIGRGRDNKGPADRAKKQGTRMLKAACREECCAFVCRVAATPVREIGPPHCPKHGEMQVEWPEDEEAEEAEAIFADAQQQATERPSSPPVLHAESV
jgi:hypothetical protein